MKIHELFELNEADIPKQNEFRNAPDFTQDRRDTDRAGYDQERKQKLGQGGTLSTIYNQAIEKSKEGDFSMLDNFIIASILTSYGFDQTMINRNNAIDELTNNPDSVKKIVGVMRGINAGTHQAQKTLNAYIENAGNLSHATVSKEGRDMSAREYWTKPFFRAGKDVLDPHTGEIVKKGKAGSSTPNILSKSWTGTMDFNVVEAIMKQLSAQGGNVTAKRLSELFNVVKDITANTMNPKSRNKFAKIHNAEANKRVSDNLTADKRDATTPQPITNKEPEKV